MAIGGLLSGPYAAMQGSYICNNPVKHIICQNKAGVMVLFVNSSLEHSQLLGRPGGLGLGEASLDEGSPSMGRPKICSNSLASGGGMGKRPMAISTNESPMLQISDCTE